MELLTNPRSLTYELLLTATTPLSHHDPAVQDDSNRTLFNRQSQILPRSVGATAVPQHLIDTLTQTYQVPIDIVDIFRELTFSEFVAIALVREYLDIYNSQDGSGLFTGMARYERLEARLRQSAIVAMSLGGLWDHLVASTNVPVHAGEHDHRLLILQRGLPAGAQVQVLRAITDNYRSIMAIARLWHSESKLADARYAAAAGRQPITEWTRLHYQAETTSQAPADVQVVEVPALSGNAARHEVVRWPAWLHLCRLLGLEEATPGQGAVPAGVEALFVNGGNIAAGAKQPSNSFALAIRSRSLYPTLDLLGGVTDAFDLGESRLRCAAWIVCSENLPALRNSPAGQRPNAQVSVFDLIDDVTQTRQASPQGLGQMIRSFETLATGVEILVRCTLTPFTPRNTRGALLAAIDTYLADDATLAGQAARGFGHMAGALIRRPSDDDDLRAEYEAYLQANAELLRAGLIVGTLGTGTRILS